MLPGGQAQKPNAHSQCQPLPSALVTESSSRSKVMARAETAARGAHRAWGQGTLGPPHALQSHSPEWGSRARGLRDKSCSNPNSTETRFEEQMYITRQRNQRRKKPTSHSSNKTAKTLLTGLRDRSGKAAQDGPRLLGPRPRRGGVSLPFCTLQAGNALRSSLAKDRWQDRCVVGLLTSTCRRLAVTEDCASRTSQERTKRSYQAQGPWRAPGHTVVRPPECQSFQQRHTRDMALLFQVLDETFSLSEGATASVTADTDALNLGGCHAPCFTPPPSAQDARPLPGKASWGTSLHPGKPHSVLKHCLLTRTEWTDRSPARTKRVQCYGCSCSIHGGDRGLSHHPPKESRSRKQSPNTDWH